MKKKRNTIKLISNQLVSNHNNKLIRRLNYLLKILAINQLSSSHSSFLINTLINNLISITIKCHKALISRTAKAILSICRKYQKTTYSRSLIYLKIIVKMKISLKNNRKRGSKRTETTLSINYMILIETTLQGATYRFLKSMVKITT